MSQFDPTQHLALWQPPERLSLSRWAEKHLVLSSEYTARSGPIKLYEYQKGIFDAFTDPATSAIVVMSSTQMVKTLLLQAIIGYTIAEDPLPILLIQPTDAAAKKFSKRRIGPMLRDCPILDGIVQEVGAGKDGTLQERSFPGGSLTIAGAGSPTSLASASVAILLSDELDKWESNVGNHGDPLSQAKARLTTFGSRAKIVSVCSPTDEHTSTIAREFANSDQRQAWVPCHKCNHSQVLKFANVRWDNTLRTIADKAKTAHYECESCGAHWNDLQRWQACEKMQWIAQQPFAGIAGFNISHLYSPWHKLEAIVSDWLKCQNDWTQRKTFINNTLAELWKVEGLVPDETKLYARRESYPHGLEDAVIPNGGVFLTAAVDVQQDRLECEIRAWGRDKESWSIAYEVIQVLGVDGRTPLPSTAPDVWDQLNTRILQRDWPHESGGTLPIMLMAIDTGYQPQAVYEFCLQHPQPLYTPTGGMRVRSMRSVVPVRGGDDDLKIIAGISSENAARKRQNVRIVTLGTHCAKSELYDSLRNVQPRPGETVPNAIHFPEYTLDYFKGLCSEHRIVKGNGDHSWEKKPNARNEPLDLAVYNRGAASLIGIDQFREAHWQQLESKFKTNLVEVAVAASAPAPASLAPAPTAPQRSWQNLAGQQPRRTVRKFNI